MKWKLDPVATGGELLGWWSRFGIENDRTWTRALIVILLLSFAVPILGPLNHDVAWHLYAAQQMLAGQKLYVDLIEYNPPFIYLFNIPIVALAQLLGISAENSFLSLILISALALYYLCYRLFGMVGAQLGKSVPRLLLLAFICLTVPFIPFEFGQRDHLMTLFFLPYALLLGARVQKHALPGWIPVLVGVTGAVGLAFKPQYLLLWMVVEAYAWLWEGIKPPWRRPEALAVGSFFLAYGLFVVSFMREYFAVIQTAAETYPSFDNSPWESLAHSARFPLIALATYLIVQPNRRNSVLCRLLALSTVAALGVAVASQKGWFYHFIPSHIFGGLLLVLVLVTLVDESLADGSRVKPYQAFTSLMVLVVMLDLVAGSIHQVSVRRGSWQFSDEGQLVELIQPRETTQRIVFFSTSMFPAFPVVNYTNSLWGMRFPFLWFIPGLYPDGFTPRLQEDSMSPIEREFFDQVIEDFLSNRPRYVITDDRIHKQGLENITFDYLEYFSQDPRFSAGWKDYQLLRVAGAYRVFQRNEIPPDLSRGEVTGTGEESGRQEEPPATGGGDEIPEIQGGSRQSTVAG